MKSILVSLSLLLAATAALVLLPVRDLAAGGDILTGVGILAIFLSDYRRILRPRRASAEILPFPSGGPSPVRLAKVA